MITPKIKKEIEHLVRGFIGAIIAAAVIAALNWIGTEIPIAIHAIALLGAGYAGSHTIG